MAAERITREQIPSYIVNDVKPAVNYVRAGLDLNAAVARVESETIRVPEKSDHNRGCGQAAQHTANDPLL